MQTPRAGKQEQNLHVDAKESGKAGAASTSTAPHARARAGERTAIMISQASGMPRPRIAPHATSIASHERLQKLLSSSVSLHVRAKRRGNQTPGRAPLELQDEWGSPAALAVRSYL